MQINTRTFANFHDKLIGTPCPYSHWELINLKYHKTPLQAPFFKEMHQLVKFKLENYDPSKDETLYSND